MIVTRGLGSGLLITRGYGTVSTARLSLAVDPSYGFQVTSSFNSNILEFESGRECRNSKATFSKRKLDVKYAAVSKHDADLIYGFLLAQKGKYEVFSFYMPAIERWEGDYVGRGNGLDTVFDLPCRDSSSLIVYVDGAMVNGTVLVGAGTEGIDRYQFPSAPVLGSVITADFEGRLKLNMRLDVDKVSREMFQHLIYSIGTTFTEVRQ